jgi:hypothetical protein
VSAYLRVVVDPLLERVGSWRVQTDSAIGTTGVAMPTLDGRAQILWSLHRLGLQFEAALEVAVHVVDQRITDVILPTLSSD